MSGARRGVHQAKQQAGHVDDELPVTAALGLWLFGLLRVCGVFEGTP